MSITCSVSLSFFPHFSFSASHHSQEWSDVVSCHLHCGSACLWSSERKKIDTAHVLVQPDPDSVVPSPSATGAAAKKTRAAAAILSQNERLKAMAMVCVLMALSLFVPISFHSFPLVLVPFSFFVVPPTHSVSVCAVLLCCLSVCVFESLMSSHWLRLLSLFSRPT